MNEAELKDRYFNWLVKKVYPEGNDAYYHLLRFLFERQFNFLMPNDGNRAEDGIDLRYRFGNAYSISDPEICGVLDQEPCSMLEMMVALALRVDEQIFDPQDDEDEATRFFVSMLGSLGLFKYSDEHFDIREVDRIIRRFENRTYERNGRGGLFYIQNCREDMRTLEIWYQMMLYLNQRRSKEIKSFLTAD